MSVETAAKIVAMRPLLEALAVKATSDPESVSDPLPTDAALMSIIQSLSEPRAARFGITEEEPPQTYVFYATNTRSAYKLYYN